MLIAAGCIGRSCTPQRELRSIPWVVLAHDNLTLSGTEAFSYESVRAQGPFTYGISRPETTKDAAREPKLEGGAQTAVIVILRRHQRALLGFCAYTSSCARGGAQTHYLDQEREGCQIGIPLGKAGYKM